jgi:uncharacterized membrane protein YbhN (UPF0104 family)
VLGGAVALALAGAISVATVDGDSGTDVVHLVRRTAAQFADLRWGFAAIVIGLGALHYIATAVAARAAAGIALPFWETVLVQLAASAANRITPGGLGGSAVNARYFTRRGMDLPVAVGAVTSLTVLGGLADLFLLSALVLVGSWVGLIGASVEIPLLFRHIRSVLGPLRSPWLWLAVVLVCAVAGALWWRWHGSRRVTTWSRVLVPLRRLASRPRSMATLLGASAATTLVLGFAFIATTAMVPGVHPSAGFGALLVGFMLGAAAGSAVPTPAGLGSTEAALAAVLIAARVPAAQAVEEVLVFRLMTFWAPAAIGVLSTRLLLRRGAL